MSYQRKKIPLPPRLLRNLQKLAQTYESEGLDLFIFGSFARGDQRSASDLDLGVEWHKERNARTFLRLYGEVQALPTIRKIELVDFSQTSSTFRQIASLNKVYLSERKLGQREKTIP